MQLTDLTVTDRAHLRMRAHRCDDSNSIHHDESVASRCAASLVRVRRFARVVVTQIFLEPNFVRRI